MPSSEQPAASDSVVAWRTTRLRHAGLPAKQAGQIAADWGYDLHAVLELVDRGCPVKVAVRILAPLHDGPT